MAKKSSSGGFGKLLLGFVLGVAAVMAGGYAYLNYGQLPVAVSDAPFLLEKQLVRIPLHNRIDREKKILPSASVRMSSKAVRRSITHSARAAMEHRAATSDTQSRCIPPLLSFGRSMHTAT